MLNLNKTKIRGISLILVLVMALALCLTGCKDADARKMAESASKDAASKLTEAQVSEAINKALTDYAKKSDVTTLEAVKSEITSALADYVKKTDAAGHLTAADVNTAVTEALKTYATTASVQELINQAKTELGAQVTAAQQNLQATVDKATADASGKMDLSVWKGILDDVIEKCQDVDHAETEAKKNQDIYTTADWQRVLDIYYGAKIKLYRAYDKTDVDGVMQWVNDEIAKIPTAVSVAKEVQELILAIGFPATTDSKNAVEAARAKYDTWKDTYPAFATEAGAQAKGISVGLLEYAEDKFKDKLTPESTRINGEIRAFIEKNAGLLEITDAATKTDAQLLTEAIAKADKMTSTHLETLEALYTDYVTFVGEKVTFTPAELKSFETLDKYQLKNKDTKYDNNGVGQLSNGDSVVYLSPALEKLIDAAYAYSFNELKTAVIKDVLFKMSSINDADPTYKAQVTRLGTQFADVMEAELQWTEAFYHAECNEHYNDAENPEKGYIGSDYTQKYNSAKEHLQLLRTATVANDSVNGFYYYLEQVAVKKGDSAYVEATYAKDFVKQVIKDCYLGITAQTSYNDKYEEYKIRTINEIAEITKCYIDGDKTNDFGMETFAATQRAKDAAKNLVLAYIPQIRAMTFRDDPDYSYSRKGDQADKEADEHFKVIVAEFQKKLEKIPAAENDVPAYETTESAVTAIRTVIIDACATAKANVAPKAEGQGG